MKTAKAVLRGKFMLQIPILRKKKNLKSTTGSASNNTGKRSAKLNLKQIKPKLKTSRRKKAIWIRAGVNRDTMENRNKDKRKKHRKIKETQCRFSGKRKNVDRPLAGLTKRKKMTH